MFDIANRLGLEYFYYKDTGNYVTFVISIDGEWYYELKDRNR